MPRVFPAFADLPLRDKGLVVVSIPVLSLLIVLAAMVFVQREEHQAERLVRHSMDVRQNMQLAPGRGEIGLVLDGDFKPVARASGRHVVQAAAPEKFRLPA